MDEELDGWARRVGETKKKRRNITPKLILMEVNG
jgi:hypothetical protein